jgi:hypothetical protein
MKLRKLIMTNKPLNAQMDYNHNYNCPNDSDHVGATGPGKIDVIIPAHLPEFGTGAARALLHLLVEAHRTRTAKNGQSTEDT